MRSVVRAYWLLVMRGKKPVLRIRCPDCGRWMRLDSVVINQRGCSETVVPCPESVCNFRDYVKLEDFRSEGLAA
jgi:hypothetical protein